MDKSCDRQLQLKDKEMALTRTSIWTLLHEIWSRLNYTQKGPALVPAEITEAENFIRTAPPTVQRYVDYLKSMASNGQFFEGKAYRLAFHPVFKILTQGAVLELYSGLNNLYKDDLFPHAMFVFDIAGFGEINAKYGYEAANSLGNRLIQVVLQTIDRRNRDDPSAYMNSARTLDEYRHIPAQITTGDEVMILALGMKDENIVQRKVNDIRTALEKEFVELTDLKTGQRERVPLVAHLVGILVTLETIERHSRNIIELARELLQGPIEDLKAARKNQRSNSSELVA